MAGPPHEFEEPFDDEHPDRQGPLLPPEDRLWRHPSEVGAHERAISSEALAAQDRWLTATPTRAGAWSAGLVGAVLATGVVFVGMHISTWVSRGHAGRPQVTLTTDALAATATTSLAGNISTSMLERVKNAVAKSLVFVKVTANGQTTSADGIVLDTKGTVLVPASLVTQSSSSSPAGAPSAATDSGLGITVTTSNDEVLSGQLRGSDVETGLAVVTVETDDLTPLQPATTTLQPEEWMGAEWTAPSGNAELNADSQFGAVSSFGAASALPSGYKLSEWVEADIPEIASAPIGSVLVNGAGQFVGVLTGRDKSRLVEVPAAVAERVVAEILQYGKVEPGFLSVAGVPGTSPAESYLWSLAAKRQPAPHQALVKSAAPTLDSGFTITAVKKGSPAASSGLRPGDVIVDVDGQAVTSQSDLDCKTYLAGPTAKVDLTVSRNGSVMQLQARLQKAA